MEQEKIPKLILFCGLPGSGKTTLAREIAEETEAVRLCPDEWMTDLGIDLFDEEFRVKLEVKLWELAKELLRNGQDVILENGFWSRQERDDKRRDVENLNVVTEMHFLDVPVEELVRRLEIRNTSGALGVVPLKRENIEKYSRKFEAPDANELALFTHAIVHKHPSR